MNKKKKIQVIVIGFVLSIISISVLITIKFIWNEKENFFPLVTAGLGFYAVHSFNQYTKRKNQDEQTDWVPRLIKVATETTEDTLTKETIYQVLSTLRPFPHKVTDPHRYEESNNCDPKGNCFDEFTDISIDYCNNALTGETEDNLEVQAKKIRLIANMLLKYHWEWQDFTTSTWHGYPRNTTFGFQLKVNRYKDYQKKCQKMFEQFKLEIEKK